jgi:hypothetical protein
MECRGTVSVIFRRVLFLGFMIGSYSSFAESENQPNLSKLSQSGYMINSNSSSYPTHSSWADMTRLMTASTVFDRISSQIEAVICGSQMNRSVLLVGEPSDTWRYIFARLATKSATGKCLGTSHVEIDISKIEAGHMYVGQVDQYWRDEVLGPADGRNAVLYLANLNQLMGLGSHSNDDTGIEAEYSNNIASGRLRSVAFMNKFEYEYYLRSKDAYVLNSFALTVKLDNLTLPEVSELQLDYLRILAPNFSLVPKEQQYLNRTAEFYLPNVLEPQRSMAVLKKMIQANGGAIVEAPENLERFEEPVSGIESTHPYGDSESWTKTLDYPDAKQIALHFSLFKTETTYDKVTIRHGATNAVLATFSGTKSEFETTPFVASSLIIEFTSDTSTNSDGFIVDKVILFKTRPEQAPPAGVVFNREEIRRTILEIAQVPGWIINRRFDAIRDLRTNLDLDVVGCHQAKDDAVRLAKVGYVGGRTDDKPVAAHMFVGPTGTGKSYIAKRLADFLGIKLITFDMTAYRTPESFDRFLDTLAESLILYPYAIYLFEEVDKADSKILDRLYFMTDEGILYDKYQRPLFARGAYIIITTNAAEDAILSNPNNPELSDIVDAELRKFFRPSFLNRLDAVSIFKPFTQPEYRQLANIMINKKVKAVQSLFDWSMSVDTDSIEYLAKYGQSPRYGARPMERLIDGVVSAGVAEWQLAFGPLEAESTVAISKQQAPHEFMCSSSNQDVRYNVDPNVNNGGSFQFESSMNAEQNQKAMLQAKIYQMLQSQPVWSERD